MSTEKIAQDVESGNISLGIELGSTRIKAVLVTPDFKTIAAGSYVWENELKDGVWTYSLEKVWAGIQASYQDMAAEVQTKYGVTLTKIGAVGVSAMMHGYMAFNKDDQLLVPFRTWRNNITEQAADDLTKLFDFNIPQRWSIAHLYQAILNQEDHVKDVSFLTTLAGYVHWQLSGEKVVGIGDASGIFPIDSATKTYNQDFLDQFRGLKSVRQYLWNIEDILPKV